MDCEVGKNVGFIDSEIGIVKLTVGWRLTLELGVVVVGFNVNSSVGNVGNNDGDAAGERDGSAVKLKVGLLVTTAVGVTEGEGCADGMKELFDEN